MFRPISIAFMLAVLAVAPARAEKAPLQLLSAKGAKPAAPIDAQAVIDQANSYFNNAGTMIADFVQIGGDGRRTDGKLFVQRPGRMRFAYAPPATLDIIADGTSVAIIDRKLHTQDLYFIGQTPLKFLLNDSIDLNRDTKILDLETDGAGGVSIDIEDKSTFGGTSKLRLTFDEKPFALRQWTVTDPQGYETVVSLSNIDLNTKPDPALFQINTERMLNSRK
ncbi:MAG TPA: outer-membrane lipoprotein carrier protein LolA [Lichenihabitans sp.]|jgi:outer membrane lipoprotein-sorting protein|nr:outer-membrane lipoprotein carrier protein LolA [Lichenihabitans sp.]